MVGQVEQHVTWGNPSGWLVGPARGEEESWVADVLRASSAADASPLGADLRRFLEFSRGFAGPNPRKWIAAVLPDPAGRTRIVAAGWIEIGSTADVDELARIAHDSPKEPGIYSRQVTAVEERRRSYVAIYDLIADNRRVDQPILRERAAVVAVHHLARFTVTVQMSTTDIGAFEDLAATCAQVATSVRFPRSQAS